MLRSLVLTAVAVALAGPALAASDTMCSTAKASKFQPKSALIKQLNSQGLKVKQIKTENGCYEAYTVDQKGKLGTFAFNAETLKPVANPEAGEN